MTQESMLVENAQGKEYEIETTEFGFKALVGLVNAIWKTRGAKPPLGDSKKWVPSDWVRIGPMGAGKAPKAPLGDDWGF